MTSIGASTALSTSAADALATFESGLELYRERRFQEAMGAFLDVLEQEPGNEAARRYQAAALKGWVFDRSLALRRESLEMMRLSLRSDEADQVAYAMCREAFARVEIGDAVAASDFLHRALELKPAHPEVRRGLERVQELVRGQLALHRVRELPEARAMIESLEGLLLLNAGDSPGARPFFERALALSDPGDALDAYLQRFARLARAGADVTRIPEEKALPPAPSREREGEEATAAPAQPPTRVYGPPTLLPAPSATLPSRSREGTEGRASDVSGSESAYIRGVTEYMAGRVGEARAAMREALRLFPENQRAKKMLKRLDKEAASQ